MAAMSDLDFAFALQLQEQFNAELDTLHTLPPDASPDPTSSDSNPRGSTGSEPRGSASSDPRCSGGEKGGEQPPASLIDPAWELIDPNPDARALFIEFNKKYFWSALDGVEVRWSPRMTLCAGICCYEGHGGLCSIRLSQPLLVLRPRKDLVETLLHEMIHAYLFVTDNDRDHDGHGPNFCRHMHRLNKLTGTKITVSLIYDPPISQLDIVFMVQVRGMKFPRDNHIDRIKNINIYHEFHDEVANYQTHWWRCDGPCQSRKPYYGYVKRAMNRAPSRNDAWWAEHQRTCGGTFTKIREPEGFGDKKGKKSRKDEAEGVSASIRTSKITDWMKTTPVPTLSKPTNSDSAFIDLGTDEISDLELVAAVQSEESDLKRPAKFPGRGNVLGGSKDVVSPNGSSSAVRPGLAPAGSLQSALFKTSFASTAAPPASGVNSVAGGFLSKALSSAGKVLKEPPPLRDNSSGNVLKEIPANASMGITRCNDVAMSTPPPAPRDDVIATLQRKRPASNATPSAGAKPRLAPTAATSKTPSRSETILRYLSNPCTPVGTTVFVPNFTSVCNARAHRKNLWGKDGDGGKAPAASGSPALTTAPPMKKQRTSPDGDAESEFADAFRKDPKRGVAGTGSLHLASDDAFERKPKSTDVDVGKLSEGIERKPSTDLGKMSDAFESAALFDLANYDMEDEKDDHVFKRSWIDLTESAGSSNSGMDTRTKPSIFRNGDDSGELSERKRSEERGTRDAARLGSGMELGDGGDVAGIRSIPSAVMREEKGESGSASDMVPCPVCAAFVNPLFINDHLDSCLRA